ncbi:hypothetical protein FUA23_14375 [Neolewinella aurantiaca]|uniref:Uncharacterized protein n=1 Tax=Neolewinella aurantiaca TaxID=2602767 RepID=A0A5C7FE04_9BACT|nr:hypothetical protein [Neolewinella aurantiaca]TXF88468.1 hypothetical protein FUA23_14375 [Neolewinella aurantiaca]
MDYLLELKSGYDRVAHLLDIPDNTSGKESLLNQFFHLLIHGVVGTDEEAAEKLYGAGKDGSFPPYQKLKAKLKIHLPYRLCQLTTPVENAGPSTVFVAKMYLLWGRECKARHKVMATEWLMKEAFRLGESVEQFRIAREAAEELCELYAGPLYNPGLFQRFRKAVAHNAEQEETLGILQMHYYKLRGMETRRDRRLREAGNSFEAMFNETVELTRNREGTKVVNYGYGILVSISMLRRDPALGRKFAEEALVRAKNQTYRRDSLLKVKATSLIVQLSKLGDHHACLQVLEEWKHLSVPGTLGRYVYIFYRIISLLSLGRYPESVVESRAVNIAEVKKGYSKENALSYYFIFAYQFILAKAGLVPSENLPSQVANFRLHRFMNQVQVFEKNKQGYNIHIRIIELFHLVIHRNYDTFIDRMESVDKYVQRYLSEPEHRRNGLFLQLLASAGRYNFDADALELGEKKQIAEFMALENTAFLIDTASTEFIPYEAQWKIFLDILRAG